MIIKDFWNFGIKNNTGLLYHIAGGKALSLLARLQGESYFMTLWVVLVLAVAWEMCEVMWGMAVDGGFNEFLQAKKYHSVRAWLCDSVADIFGALFGAL